jgi:hypothetical protein
MHGSSLLTLPNFILTFILFGQNETKKQQKAVIDIKAEGS